VDGGIVVRDSVIYRSAFFLSPFLSDFIRFISIAI